jgi:hypothetical protein
VNEEGKNTLKDLVSLYKKVSEGYDDKIKLGASFGLFASLLLADCEDEEEVFIKMMAANDSLMSQAKLKFKKNPGHGAQWQ